MLPKMDEQLYDLELDRCVEEVKKSNAKKVLLHLPDGLKPKSKEVVDYLKERAKGVEFFIWAGSCYGACDIPVEASNLGIDLLIHWGHTSWKF